MLNMRDNRNRADKSETNGRAVSITHDLGQSWQVHPTDHDARLLPEPVCMASLLALPPRPITIAETGGLPEPLPSTTAERVERILEGHFRIGVPMNLEEALRWYQLAARQGNENARMAARRLQKDAP